MCWHVPACMVIGGAVAFGHQRTGDAHTNHENKNADYTIRPQILIDSGFLRLDCLCKILLPDENGGYVVEVRTDGIERIATTLKQLILGCLLVIIKQMLAPNQSAKDHIKNKENQNRGCQDQITDGSKRAIACA